MRNRKNDKWKENGHALICPHCGVGADGVTLGLFWDLHDRCWRCIICGYRQYRDAERPRTQAEIVAERIWDAVIEELEKEQLILMGK
jgi:rubredoxin